MARNMVLPRILTTLPPILLLPGTSSSKTTSQETAGSLGQNHTPCLSLSPPPQQHLHAQRWADFLQNTNLLAALSYFSCWLQSSSRNVPLLGTNRLAVSKHRLPQPGGMFQEIPNPLSYPWPMWTPKFQAADRWHQVPKAPGFHHFHISHKCHPY